MGHVEYLTESNTAKKVGNHRVAVYAHERNYIYYSTTICTEYPKVKAFYIDDSYGTQSTKRACDKYRRHFLQQGYTEVEQRLRF